MLKAATTPIRHCLMRSLSVLLLLMLGAAHCPAQSNAPQQPAVLRQMIAKTGNDTNKISLLLTTGMTYLSMCEEASANIDTAISFFAQGVALSHSLKENDWEAQCQYYCSLAYCRSTNYQQAEHHMQLADDLALKYRDKEALGDFYVLMSEQYQTSIPDEYRTRVSLLEKAASLLYKTRAYRKYADALCNTADLYRLSGNLRKAVDAAEKAVATYEKNHLPDIQYPYSMLATEYFYVANYEASLKYNQLAVRTAEASHDTANYRWSIYYRIAQLYDRLKPSEQAIGYYQQALAITLESDVAQNAYLITQHIADIYYRKNDFKNALRVIAGTNKRYENKPDGSIPLSGVSLLCYTALHQQDSAKRYERELLTESAGMDKYHPMQAWTYRFLASYYLQTGSYLKARQYCIYNDSFCKHTGYATDLSDNYALWYRADSALGDFATALAHFKMATLIKDSILNVEKTERIATMQFNIQYETEKKIQDIKLLTKLSALQNKQLKQTMLIRNIGLAGIAMLIIMLGLGYNRYRLKQRSNKALQEQKDEIDQKNESLRRLIAEKDSLLSEKEWLVKEIHHRVKNNLQIVMSLLNTQSMYLSDEAAVRAINESQHRMQAMSLIHQKLYQSDNVTTVNMHAYIAELVDYLKESIEPGKQVSFHLDVDSIELDVAQAIPVGLILNEAITNAIKYAFPDRAGLISISMKRDDFNHIQLLISDDGIGLPVNSSAAKKSSSLGMSLIKGLTNQLEGELSMTNDQGFKIGVDFPYLPGSPILA